MNENFIINTDRLRNHKELKLKIDMSVPCDFLEIDEPGLDFNGIVEIKGETYIVDDQLILLLDAVVPFNMVCKICNGDAALTVQINNFYHVEDLTVLKKHYFDFGKVLREEILVAVPKYPECSGGNCPEREFMNQYIRTEK